MRWHLRSLLSGGAELLIEVRNQRWSSRKRRTSMSDTSDSRSDTMDDCMAAMVLMRLSVSPKSPRLSGSDSGECCCCCCCCYCCCFSDFTIMSLQDVAGGRQLIGRPVVVVRLPIWTPPRIPLGPEFRNGVNTIELATGLMQCREVLLSIMAAFWPFGICGSSSSSLDASLAACVHVERLRRSRIAARDVALRLSSRHCCHRLSAVQRIAVTL
ncbi:zinc finger protein-like [Tropilaelaps mercedesae]|uniref:Zinc finger protein-like n=1 Tax=Tropilaelaps mercedesae TaxID=418985 RepID=A0A1V9X7C7_9ACAR|nr:zinc finger protein-like [Tropilaelaps mercedesae]